MVGRQRGQHSDNASIMIMRNFIYKAVKFANIAKHSEYLFILDASKSVEAGLLKDGSTSTLFKEEFPWL